MQDRTAHINQFKQNISENEGSFLDDFLEMSHKKQEQKCGGKLLTAARLLTSCLSESVLSYVI